MPWRRVWDGASSACITAYVHTGAMHDDRRHLAALWISGALSCGICTVCCVRLRLRSIHCDRAIRPAYDAFV